MNKLPLFSVVIGAALGFVLSSFIGLSDDVAEALYDRAFPVMDARAEVVHKTPTQWIVTMYSKKMRDCRLLEVQAYDISATREVKRLQFGREDGAPPSPMPPGNFRSANYVLQPPPSGQLSLSFTHECNGRTVRSPVPVAG